MTASAAPASSADGANATIVFVHGAWADASSWTAEIKRLQRDGYTVAAIPNTLRGPSADAAVVRDYLSTLTGPVILVAHSYGGFVITNAATGNDNVKALIYVDAFIPDEGQTAGQLAGPDSAVAVAVSNPTAFLKLVPYPGAPEGIVDTYLLPQSVHEHFANDLPADEADVISATQRPASLAALGEPSGPPAWKQIRSWALIGTNDHIIPPAEQRKMAQNAGAEISEFDASHVGLISQPDVVSDLIEKVAREVGVGPAVLAS
jgi:pimeloyl-ACP methyl ester carboxylesterase